MASKIYICSMALTEIGCNMAVDLDAPTKDEERYCKLFWDQTVKELLEEHDWKFAREYKSLLAEASSPTEEYDYSYQLPNDCLLLRYLWDDDAGAVVTDDEYEIMGRSIVTNLETVNVVYTKNDTDTGAYPAFFVRALVYLLASKLAPKLSDKAGLSTEMEGKYQRVLAKAVERDSAQNNYPINTDDDPWLKAAGFAASTGDNDDSEVIYVAND